MAGAKRTPEQNRIARLLRHIESLVKLLEDERTAHRKEIEAIRKEELEWRTKTMKAALDIATGEKP